MNDPQLILADEPAAQQVHEHGRAAVMVTHDERVLDLCDRVVSIVDGRLSEGG